MKHMAKYLRSISRLSICAGLAVAAIPALAGAAVLDQSKPEDALKIMQKSVCSLNEGEDIIHWWTGSMYSRVEGEKDRELFKLQGMNIRQCLNLNDKKRGPGFRSVSREIMIHLDPETGEIVDKWTNPWTKEELDVFHVANDPVNMRSPMYAYKENGDPIDVKFTVMNGRAMRGGNTPLFYENPLGGEYQDWVGGKYHAMEMGNDYFYADDLFDGTKANVEHKSLSWSRISGWLPWMKMGDRNGVVYTVTIGGRVKTISELPKELVEAIETRYPKYVSPPPLNDDRPNETSWEVFKKKKAEDAEKGEK